MSFITWVIDNFGTIMNIATAIVTAASGIAALTPTPKDDSMARAAYRIIDTLALNIGKAKDK